MKPALLLLAVYVGGFCFMALLFASFIFSLPPHP